MCNIFNTCIIICRFLSAKSTFAYGLSLRMSRVTVLVIWIYGIVGAVPTYFMTELFFGTLCSMAGADTKYSHPYTIYTRVINYFLPLIVMWTCYMGVACRIQRTLNKVCGTALQIGT
jgi:hypothetical protein